MAIGEMEMMHIIPRKPYFHHVPLSPVYCHLVFLWQNEIIPVLDLNAYFDVGDDDINDFERFTCIINYSNENGKVSFGGLLLSSIPVRISVADEQACELPDDIRNLHYFSRSCFYTPDSGATPILNLSRLFSAQPEFLQSA